MPPGHHLKVLILAGPEPPQSWLRSFGNVDSVMVGRRPATATAGSSQWFALTQDLHIGKEHARMFRNDAGWSIEDLGSKNGTYLNASRLDPEAPKPIATGDLVRTGATVWTPIPPGGFAARWRSALLVGRCLGYISRAAHQCGFRFLWDLRAKLLGQSAMAGFRLEIRLGDVSAACGIEIPSLSTIDEIPLPDPRIEFIPDRLSADVAGVVQLHAEVGGVQLRTSHKLIDWLGAKDMVLDRCSLRSAAALVTPEHSAVETLVRRCESKFQGPCGSHTFRGALRTDALTVEETVTACLYHHLQRCLRLEYELPQTRRSCILGWPYQTTRPPASLLASETGPVCPANCLDLSLLFASCGEAVGLLPLLVFLGAKDRPPNHALVGFWKGHSPGLHPILEDRTFRRRLSQNDLFVVESTLLAGAGSHAVSTTFTEAMGRARTLVEKADWCLGVDVATIRRDRWSSLE